MSKLLGLTCRTGGFRLAAWPLGLILLSALALGGCKEEAKAEGDQATPPPEVTVVTLKTQPVTLTNELPGRTSAYRSAQVRPQVTGVIEKRLFTEGTEVKAGQQLYQIDPAPYEATLASDRAAVAKAQASAKSAKLTMDRYKNLTQAHAISQQEYDDAVATYEQDVADIASAKAAVQSALINLAYTKVYAPIDGITSRSAYTEGALVTANQTDTMVTVTQLDPIYVDVTQPANALLRLKRELAAGRLKQVGDNQAQVTLVLDDGTVYPDKGKLLFSEVTVDEGTGSVVLRAVFPNKDRVLMPGMFVRERVDEGQAENAILVPQRGLTRNSKGDATVLLVDKDGKVAERVVKTERTVGDAWLVSSGVAAGDRVIVEGLQKVQPGQAVKPEEAGPELAGMAGGAQAANGAGAK